MTMLAQSATLAPARLPVKVCTEAHKGLPMPRTVAMIASGHPFGVVSAERDGMTPAQRFQYTCALIDRAEEFADGLVETCEPCMGYTEAWGNERGIMLFGGDVEMVARSLGKTFGQHSVLTDEGLVALDGDSITSATRAYLWPIGPAPEHPFDALSLDRLNASASANGLKSIPTAHLPFPAVTAFEADRWTWALAVMLT